MLAKADVSRGGEQEMPRCDDEDEHRWDPEDDVDEAEGEEEDEDDFAPCPYCRRPIYDDAERCPECGAYLSREDEPYRKPWWLIVGVAACLYAVYRWVVRP
jgi:hypothetical protein